VTGLTPGATYKFVVQSRNLINFSEYSASITELAAQIPDAPTGLANVLATTNADQIGITWVAPVFDGGSPLIDYSIWYDDASGSTFTELVSGVTDLSYTATLLTQG
jgi:hypothetical protein